MANPEIDNYVAPARRPDQDQKPYYLCASVEELREIAMNQSGKLNRLTDGSLCNVAVIYMRPALTVDLARQGQMEFVEYPIRHALRPLDDRETEKRLRAYLTEGNITSTRANVALEHGEKSIVNNWDETPRAMAHRLHNLRS